MQTGSGCTPIAGEGPKIITGKPCLACGRAEYGEPIEEVGKAVFKFLNYQICYYCVQDIYRYINLRGDESEMGLMLAILKPLSWSLDREIKIRRRTLKKIEEVG